MGCLKETGRKFDRDLDVIYMQRNIKVRGVIGNGNNETLPELQHADGHD